MHSARSLPVIFPLIMSGLTPTIAHRARTAPGGRQAVWAGPDSLEMDPLLADMKQHFIQPGKPVQNAFVESFNGTFRDNCLNEHWFRVLRDARRIINAWRVHYNCVRPHSSQGYVPPETYAQRAA